MCPTTSARRSIQPIVALQRARLFAALSASVDERGVGELTITRVLERSSVSRRTFYGLFEDLEDCLLAALEDAVERIRAAVLPPSEAEDSWRPSLRVGVCELLCFLDEEPLTARLCLLGTVGAGPRVLRRRAEVVQELVRAVDRGWEDPAAVQHPITLAGEFVVGGALAILQRRVLEPQLGSLVDLTNELLALVGAPYLGFDAARKELALQLPERAQGAARTITTAIEERNPDGDPSGRLLDDSPLGSVGLRATYRTLRVLKAIAEQPQGSNRQVALAADVSDAGQISKLLTRLQRVGLVTNSNPVPGRSNAWTLTARGRAAVQESAGWLHGVESGAQTAAEES